MPRPIRFSWPSSMPPISRKIQYWLAICTGAASTVRNLKNALPLACWIAWPTSWAATAIDATDDDCATACERCTDLSRGS